MVRGGRRGGGLEAGTSWRTGIWAHRLGSPSLTENTGPSPRWTSAWGFQLRGGVWCSGLSSECFSLAIWGVGQARPTKGGKLAGCCQACPFGRLQGKPGLLPAATRAKTAALPQAAVPFLSYRSVPGPAASTVAPPAGPTCQRRLPGGDAQGQPGARVRGGSVQLRGGLRGPGVLQRYGEGGPGRHGEGRSPSHGPALGPQMRGTKNIAAL